MRISNGMKKFLQQQTTNINKKKLNLLNSKKKLKIVFMLLIEALYTFKKIHRLNYSLSRRLNKKWLKLFLKKPVGFFSLSNKQSSYVNHVCKIYFYRSRLIRSEFFSFFFFPRRGIFILYDSQAEMYSFVSSMLIVSSSTVWTWIFS